MTRESFSGGSAPGDPGAQAPGVGAGNRGAGSRALRLKIREYKDGGWHHIYLASPWGRGGEIWEGLGEWDTPALRDLAMALLDKVLQGDLELLDVRQAGKIEKFSYTLAEEGDTIIHTLSMEGDFPPPEELARIFQR